MAPPDYTIGEFARLTGLTDKALRIYDARGLLPPAEVDEASGYRKYNESQVDDGRLIAMLRAIEMPLTDIEAVLATPLGERSAVVGTYWYRIERRLDDSRSTVRRLQGMAEGREHGMSHAASAMTSGRSAGVFAAIASLSAIEDLTEAANAYTEAMRSAYWTDKDVPLASGIAYAGVSRMLSAAESADDETAYRCRLAAKGLLYDLASFTWIGWDEPGVVVQPCDAAVGLAAARTNLAMAVDLDKGDLPLSRAHWMIGAHLLTGGQVAVAAEAFDASRRFAEAAGARPEVELASAFSALTALAAGEDGAEERLSTALDRLAAVDEGKFFVSQVTTARSVLDL